MDKHQWKAIIVAGMVLASSSALAEGKRIQKWVDDKGITHYGDVIPPQYAGEKTTEMNSQGITVKRKEPASNPKDKQAKSNEPNEQDRRDKALLNSFTTAKEIDLARDRNLQMDQAAIEGLRQRINDAEKRLEKTNASIAEFGKNKKPVPVDLTDMQKSQQAEIKKLQEQIVHKQANMDKTRARFDNDKKRFIELKSPETPPESVQPETAPADAADALPAATPAQPAP
jgi:chromosome segregation ATPase